MNHLVKRALQGTLFAAGLWMIGTGIASAASTDPTVQAPASAPIMITDNSVNLPIGAPSSGTGSTGTGTGSSDTAASGGATNSGSSSSAANAGTVDVQAPLNTPATVCGNQVGSGSSSCGSAGTAPSATDGSNGTTPTTANAPVTAPVTACGNAVGTGSASCSPTSAPAPNSGGAVAAPIGAPVLVCGNSVGLTGGASTRCSRGSTTRTTAMTPVFDPGLSASNGQLGFASAGESSLASTGSPLAKLVGAGLSLLGLGTLLARRSRVTS